jgi:MYXO-CTERM domain-containing protein
LTFNNINAVLQGSSQYVVYMTLATPGATTQNYISNPANNISAYEGNVSTIFNGLVWSNSDGIDPLLDPSAWLTPASIGWTPRAFEVSATTLPYATSSSAGVPGPGSTAIVLLAVLGLGLLTARRKTT